MTWTKLMDLDSLEAGERRIVEVQDHKILVLNHDETIYAMQATCPHMGASLKRGKIEANTIACPLHRSTFDLDTGKVQEWVPWPPVVGPVLGAVKQEHALQVYPTRIENGAIWIELDEET
jgi:nitrite reductase/ring-hydroxylating ferredoxin subunit